MISRLVRNLTGRMFPSFTITPASYSYLSCPVDHPAARIGRESKLFKEAFVMTSFTPSAESKKHCLVVGTSWPSLSITSKASNAAQALYELWALIGSVSSSTAPDTRIGGDVYQYTIEFSNLTSEKLSRLQLATRIVEHLQSCQRTFDRFGQLNGESSLLPAVSVRILPNSIEEAPSLELIVESRREASTQQQEIKGRFMSDENALRATQDWVEAMIAPKTGAVHTNYA